MKKYFRLAYCIIVALAGGCSKSGVDVESKVSELLKDPLEIVKRVRSVEPAKAMKIADMEGSDIIVAVNGYPLYKADFEASTHMFRPLIERAANKSLQDAEVAFGQFRVQYIEQFVKSRLLIDYAVSKKIMSNNDLAVKTRAKLEDYVTKGGNTISNMVVRRGNNAKYIFYQAAERVLITELVKQEIPPAFPVDMTFVSNVQSQVTIENGYASETNIMRRKMIEGWRSDIAAHKLEFMDLVQKYENDGMFEISGGGDWETVSREDDDDAELVKEAFSASVGDVFPVREDADGIDLIMLWEIVPAILDEEKKVVESEQRVLKRIRMQKVPLILRQSDADMLVDLRNQSQLQAIETFTENLATNGLNVVVYPHGKDLF